MVNSRVLLPVNALRIRAVATVLAANSPSMWSSTPCLPQFMAWLLPLLERTRLSFRAKDMIPLRPFVTSRFLYAVLLLVGVSLHAYPAERPNVLFIISDDQQHDTIHALGNADIQTPHIDSLARSGVAFTNAYIMGASSPGVCSPSRACLLTGRTLWNIENQDIWGYEISEKFKTLPEVFRENGYITFATGKNHPGAAASSTAPTLKGISFSSAAQATASSANSSTPFRPREITTRRAGSSLREPIPPRSMAMPVSTLSNDRLPARSRFTPTWPSRLRTIRANLPKNFAPAIKMRR
jgi:hypothetical protein